MMSSSAQAAADTFQRTFCTSKSPTRLPVKLISEEPRELLAETVFQFDVDHPQYGLCSARMYCGLTNTLAKHLWSQETEALLRLSARRHPALPRICETAFSDEDKVGVIVSEAPGSTLAAADIEEFRRDPFSVLRFLRLAADALRTLHAKGLIHRDIWRESFLLWDPRGGQPMQLRLTGFEMSAFVTSLADPSWRKDETERRLLREYHDRGGFERRTCRAPEIVIGDEGSSAAGMSYRSDIYSLGICAFQWLLEDIPELAEGTEYAAYVDSRLAQATQLGSQLRSLLRSMVSPYPANRPTASDVVNELAVIEDAAAFLTDQSERAYVIAIDPVTLARYTQIDEWKPYPADERLLTQQLRSHIQHDLADAVLVHHPPGAVPYVKHGNAPDQAESKWVLLGKRAVYFCHPFIARQGMRQAPLESVLHVDYILNHSRELSEIGAASARRRIPRIKVVHFARAAEVIPEQAKKLKNPSWKPVLTAVQSTATGFEGEAEFRKGVKWWLDVQRAGINIQYYAYKRSAAPSTRTPAGNEVIRLVIDRPRDDAWIEGDALRDLLARVVRKGRPAFGDFFATLRERDHGDEVSWAGDSNGRPERDSSANSGTVKWKSPHEIEVEVKSGFLPPEIGWLRPADLGGSERLLIRQTEAAAVLFDRPELMQALYTPDAHAGPAEPWQNVGAGLGGNAKDVIIEMLTYTPFYALQGPPGTGKSTVVAHAVSAFLAQRPSARVLVAAQSHYALDELAKKIVKLANLDDPAKIGARSDLIALRAETTKDTPMEAYFDSRLAEVRLAAIGQRVADLAKDKSWRSERSALLNLAGDWKKAARMWEIQERIWTSANLVFATTGTCVEQYVGAEKFDWVIVEEAAKAWCAELVMPLILGDRWTLIGDHKQLPPFGENEIQEIYAASLASQLTNVSSQASDSEVFKATLNLFGSLFERAEKNPRDPIFDPDDEEQSDRPRRKYGRWPLNQLRTQFRMDDRILRVVRDAFYDKSLVSDALLCKDDPLHGFSSPPEIRNRAVLWLDTSAHELSAHEEEHWSNEGEVAVIRQFLSELSPSPFDGSKSLAILSPYKKQNDLLRKKCPEVAALIHTTDSFQGREADVVIVSLVRTNGESIEKPMRRIGHLWSAQRTNVLLSRARELLVIVGDFVHFGSTVGTCWVPICKLFQDGRNVVPVRGRA